MRRSWIWLVLATDCRCKPPPDPSPQITTNLVVADAEADADVDSGISKAERCPEPKSIALVGEMPKRLHWMGDILTDDASAYDPDTLAKMPLVMPLASDAGVKPLPAGYEYAYGGRGLKLVKGGAVVVDLRTGNEVFSQRGCSSELGVSPYALSETGAFVECWEDRNWHTIFAIGDPSRRSMRLNSLWDFMSPDETYVVGIPIGTMGRRTLEYRPVFAASKTISTDVEPADWYPRTKVSFCGKGQIFAAYAFHPGTHPIHVLLFRGFDGAFVASAPSAGTIADVARENYLEFDASGTHMSMLQVEPGGSTPKTLVYRLERK